MMVTARIICIIPPGTGVFFPAEFATIGLKRLRNQPLGDERAGQFTAPPRTTGLRPRVISMVQSVAMNAGRFVTETRNPFSIPKISPQAMVTSIPAHVGQAKLGDAETTDQRIADHAGSNRQIITAGDQTERDTDGNKAEGIQQRNNCGEFAKVAAENTEYCRQNDNDREHNDPLKINFTGRVPTQICVLHELPPDFQSLVGVITDAAGCCEYPHTLPARQ